MQDLLEKLRSEPFEAATCQQDFLELAQLECWAFLKETLRFDESLPVSESKLRLTSLIDLAVRFLQPTEYISSLVKSLVSDLGYTYEELEGRFLENLRLDKNWRLESDLIYKIYESFEKLECKIAGLTRVCFLLEKNGYFGVDLPSYYESLLRLNPASKEALRFFKVFFLQEGRYKEAKVVTQKLVEVHENPFARATEMHELSGILLHKLNQPEPALEVLGNLPAGTGLDSSGLRYDCFVSLGSYDEAEQILLDAISSIPKKHCKDKAVLLRRLLGLYELSGRDSDALEVAEHLMEETELEMKAVEHLTHLALEKKDWEQVQVLLALVKKDLGTERRKRQVDVTMQRLRDTTG